MWIRGHTLIGVGDVRAFPILTVELPAVKGTFDAIADHSTTDAHIGAQMRAVSVQHVGLAVARAERHQILPCNRNETLAMICAQLSAVEPAISSLIFLDTNAELQDIQRLFSMIIYGIWFNILIRGMERVRRVAFVPRMLTARTPSAFSSADSRMANQPLG